MNPAGATSRFATALEWPPPAPYIEELRGWLLRGPQRVEAFRWT
jgi:hypothetical protein